MSPRTNGQQKWNGVRRYFAAAVPECWEGSLWAIGSGCCVRITLLSHRQDSSERWQSPAKAHKTAYPVGLSNGVMHVSSKRSMCHLSVDQRFAFPNNYQALFPHAFLTMECLHSRFIEWFLPKRRPMDNIEWTMHSPQEGEFALCITTFKSPCIGWFFPERRDHYDRYLTLWDVSEREVEEWKSGLLAFLKRLNWKLKRPLLLKSPPHTCRIKRFLEIFPEARFVHIHRNPHVVFQSTRKMLTVNFQLHCLKKKPGKEGTKEQ